MFKSIGKFFATAFGHQAGAGKVFHPSQTCPECGSRLRGQAAASAPQAKQEPVRQKPKWDCPNPDCPAQVRRGLAHWCSPEAMDIEGVGEALVSQLVQSGLVRDVADLYSLPVRAVANLERMGERPTKHFLDAVAASKTRDLWRLLHGLGIPHVGSGAAKALARHFPTLDDVFEASADRLMEAGDIGEVIAQGILQWHGDPVNRKLIERLRKAGLNFKSAIHEPGGRGS